MDTLPKTVKEAVTLLLSEMSGRDKLVLRNIKKDSLILFHLTWGEEIRNRFGLWSGNDALIKDAKVDHPDSVSAVIMEAVWEELQGQ
jgi:hypothetical protein